MAGLAVTTGNASGPKARVQAPAEPSRQRGHRGLHRLATFLKGLAGLLAAVAGWEAARFVGVLPAAWAPSISEIAIQFGAGFQNGTWTKVLASTLQVWLGGLLIASGIGIVWGALAGASLWIRAASSVVIGFLRPIPAIALLPIAILVLGLRPQMVLVLVIFGCTWPILFNTLYAFRELPEQYSDTARMLGYSRLQRFVRVDLVAILPGVVTGIRVSAGIGLVIAVSVELIVGTTGLGGYILQARTNGQLAGGYAGVLMGGLLGLAFTALINIVQRRLLHWSPDNRRAQS